MNMIRDLSERVLEFIRQAYSAPDDDQGFEDLALAEFAHQFAENEPYRNYCERRGATPSSVEAWTEIPAVPTAAFKEAPLVCGDSEGVEAVFRTSGTTRGNERRGAHYVRDLRFYRTASLSSFKRHVIPDAVRMHMLILGPSTNAVPDSSLAWMLDLVRGEFGGRDSRHFVDEGGLRLDSLQSELRRCVREERPVCLLGTAAAFVHLLEAMSESEMKVELAPGSRVMETGGLKGMHREVSRDELYGMLVDRLGLSEFYCVSEYGMTEMCSQFYEDVLRARTLGRAPEWRVKVVPPWVRTRVVDAETLEPLPEGRIGVLRHFDLANVNSVMAVQTDDLGVAGDDGFEILGRAAGADLRGCSIAMDQWLTSQR